MDSFLTWSALTSYSTFVAIVFMVVEFTKGIPGLRNLPTKYLSFLISFILLGVTNVVVGTFETADLVLYILSSISISLGANGLSNFNKTLVNPEDVEETEDESGDEE